LEYVSGNIQCQTQEEINEEIECLNSGKETISAAETVIILKHTDSHENINTENSEQWLVDCMISGNEVPTNKAR
jgi:hypothetical protein